MTTPLRARAADGKKIGAVLCCPTTVCQAVAGHALTLRLLEAPPKRARLFLRHLRPDGPLGSDPTNFR